MSLDRRGADLVQQQVRERVRKVADEREQPVVRVRVDRDRRRRRASVTNACSVAVARRVGRGMRRQEPRRALEQVGPRALRPAHLGAGDGMAADEPLVRDDARDEPPFVEPTSVTVASGAAASAASTARRRASSTWHGNDDELGCRNGRVVRRVGRLDGPALGRRGEGRRVRVPAAHASMPARCRARARRTRRASPVPMTATRIPTV